MTAQLISLHKAILVAGCIALASFSSCADESEVDGGRNVIGFEITAAGGDALQSRAALPAEEPPVLLYACNSDSLFLHTTTEDNLSPTDENLNTRGVPVSKDNFKSVCGAFGVKAYTTGGSTPPYMDVRVGSEDNGVWTPDGGTRFWPGSETLDFYAYAPYDNAVEDMQCSGNRITFSYTVPRSEDGKAAEAQPDLMFAFNSLNVKNATDGRVPLAFHHALAAIRFKAHETTSGTIESISIRNVYGSGTCTYDGYNATDPFEWTTAGERTDFTQDFGVDVGSESHQVTEANPEKTFMMVPQGLEGAAIEVKFKSDDGTVHTLQAPFKADGKWEAGKKYTYTISTESINWTYVFDVTPMLNLSLGETSGNYEVTSYRYRTKNPTDIQKVAWTAKRADDTYKDEIKDFKYEGEGQTDGKETNLCRLTMLPMSTTYEGDKKLRNAAPKGSAASPYDLATDGGTESQTTANCYIVNAAGTYSLPLVYGNARKNGSDNTIAYNGFKDYKDANISSPYISGASDAILVWSDAFNLFKDVKLQDNKLVFTLDQNYMQQANAIVAVRDRDKNIMWSWHIWVTEHDLSKTIGLQDYQTEENNKYQLMPYNLGWVDGKSVTYKGREIPFTFTQEGSNERRTLTVVQQGVTLDYMDAGSTYYQWGRKDPIIALKNRKEYDVCRLHETGQSDYGYRYEVKQVTLGEAIQHPNVFYISKDGKLENTRWLVKPVYNLWRGDYNFYTKTVYDPSPRGFKVPLPSVFEVFVYGSSGPFNGDIVDDHTYRVFTQRDRKGDELILTATGQRVDRESGLGTPGGLWAMDGVYYWSSEGLSSWIDYDKYNYIGYSFCLRQVAKTYTPTFGGAQTMARPVRCIRE